MVSAEMISAYFSGQVGLVAITFLMLIFSLYCIGTFLMFVFSSRKSQDYRKLLSDMYVSATIRKFAEEDKIDLEVEENKFKKWLKKKSILGKDVDSVVMEELKEKIAESSYDKTTKK